MLPMMLCGIKGANSVAKLLNSYLIRNFYGFYFSLYLVFNSLCLGGTNVSDRKCYCNDGY